MAIKHPNRFYPGIRTRIVLPFLLVVVMIAGLGIFITTRLTAGSIQERFNNQLADSAVASSNALVDIERKQLETLRLMAYTDGIADAVATRNLPLLDERLRPVAANARLDHVVIFDRNGYGLQQFYSSTNPPATAINDLSTWQIVHAVLNPNSATDKASAFMRTTPDIMLYTAAPITDKSENIVGGIVSGLTIRNVLEQLAFQSLSGIILYDANGAVLGSTFNAPPDSLALSPDRAAQVMTGTNAVSLLDTVEISSQPYQVLLAPLKLAGSPVGVLAVALPNSFLVERTSTSRNVLTVLFVCLFFGVSLVGLSVSRTITSPVARLVTTTRSIRTGDLSHRVNLSVPDELGELAVSFDAMTDQLVNRNVQVRQLYEDQLVETTRRDAVFYSISDALVVLGSDRNIILSNPRADALIKRVAGSREQRQGFIDLCTNPEALFEPATVDLGGKSYRASATEVRMPSGEMLGYVVVFHDITAIIETERLKDNLVKQMSHELRTPLTAVRGYIELVGMLEKANLSPQGTEFIRRAIDNLGGLERIINDVTDVSGILSNEFHVHLTRFSLGQLLNEQVAKWMPVMKTRQLGLSLMMLTPKLSVEADEERLGQVISHLLRNAYNYTLPGGEVIVKARGDERWARITVADTGVGIDKDEQESVFDRLYRGRSSNAGPTDSRGLGLGLYLSKCIVTALGGAITLESRPNMGTTVTVTIPRMAHNG
ncbi:MAG TPA: ATP-binding protein [Aggregatilineales bacterium]|nr:ATP-binding protein [Aggregatilineales bacterium]